MSQKSYTPEEVSKHNIWEDDEKDVWVVYGDSIYDITKFIEEHPGGEEVILDVAGDDMTVAFDNMGHSESAKRILEEYKIGRLNGQMPEKNKSNVKAVSAQPQSGFTVLHVLGALLVGVSLYGLYKFLI